MVSETMSHLNYGIWNNVSLKYSLSLLPKILSQTLVLVVTKLANTKWGKKPAKWLKPWHVGTHLRVLSESFLMNTNMIGLDGFQKWLKMTEKWLKPWHVGTYLRVLSKIFPMNTNMIGFRWFSTISAFLGRNSVSIERVNVLLLRCCNIYR